MACCGKNVRIVSAGTCIVILLVLGICSVVLWVPVYNSILRKELTITNDSTGYKFWKETPIPMYLNVYLFNWTNAQEVIKSKWSVKPAFVEVGPYVFHEHHIRTNLTWQNDNHTVTYYQKRVWHYVPEMSNGSLSDKITNINVVAAAAGYLARTQSALLKPLISFFLNVEEKSLLTTRTVDEWLFEGYQDNILKFLVSLKLPFLKMLSGDRFGWFYGRNGSETYDGNFTMFTGSNDIELLGLIDKWNGSPTSKYFDSYCSLVNGTSGELWPPVETYDKVSIFASDLCSSVRLDRVKFSEEIVGLKGNKYVGTDFVFDNGTKYPEQKCFSPNEVYPSGVRDISKCKFGAPAFVSYPHFYLADPYYRNAVDGMQPNQTKHEFYVVLEPNTGVPLDVRASMQLNVYIKKIRGISMFKNVKETFIPMVYFTQTATLTSDLAKEAKTLLLLHPIMLYTGIGFIALSVLITLAFVYISFNRAWISKEEEGLLSTSEETIAQ